MTLEQGSLNEHYLEQEAKDRPHNLNTHRQRRRGPLDAEYQFFAALGNFSQTNIPTTSFSRLWVVSAHVDQTHFVEAQMWS